jgi:hypothetical protein
MAYLEGRNGSLDPKYETLAVEYMRHGETLGLRWEYAFFQMLHQGTDVVPVECVVEAAGQLVDGMRPLHCIFHTGHVGSTLVSRLLDETGQVLSLREPLPLRTLAEAHDVLHAPESLLGPQPFDRWLETRLRLWGRGYAATRAVVVKATSSAARLAPVLLERSAGSRAIYLSLRAEPALATRSRGQLANRPRGTPNG